MKKTLKILKAMFRSKFVREIMKHTAIIIIANLIAAPILAQFGITL